jgi:hypothetical protein
MIALGIILMIIGGGIFAIGEGQSCLFMLIGAAINFTGIGMLMSAF